MELDVFLFGAGASAPLGLPVSRGFLKGFKPKNTNILDLFLKYTKARNQEELDIEQVFALLEEAIKSQTSLVFYIFEPNSGWKPTGGWKRVSTPQGIIKSVNEEVGSILRKFFNSAQEFYTELKSYILKVLSEFSAENAFNFYWSLFKDYPFKGRPLLIFTTNYDLVVEDAFLDEDQDIRREWINKGVRNLYLGFETRAKLQVFNLRKEELEKSGNVCIMKLHGSIDWKPKGKPKSKRIVLADSSVPLDPDTPFLIYPGYKGVPDEEPFLSLHLAFLDTLMKARRLIAVGFAFRDFYINSIVHHALSLNKELEVHVVVPGFPGDSLFPTLKEKFPDRVFHHQERVELQDGEVKPDLWNLIQKVESEQQ
jgi:hypothetical protein